MVTQILPPSWVGSLPALGMWYIARIVCITSGICTTADSRGLNVVRGQIIVRLLKGCSGGAAEGKVFLASPPIFVLSRALVLSSETSPTHKRLSPASEKCAVPTRPTGSPKLTLHHILHMPFRLQTQMEMCPRGALARDVFLYNCLFIEKSRDSM